MRRVEFNTVLDDRQDLNIIILYFILLYYMILFIYVLNSVFFNVWITYGVINRDIQNNNVQINM